MNWCLLGATAALWKILQQRAPHLQICHARQAVVSANFSKAYFQTQTTVTAYFKKACFFKDN